MIVCLPHVIVSYVKEEDVERLGYHLEPGEQLYYLFDERRGEAVHVFAMKPEEARYSNAVTLKNVPAKWLSESELKERSTK